MRSSTSPLVHVASALLGVLFAGTPGCGGSQPSPQDAGSETVDSSGMDSVSSSDGALGSAEPAGPNCDDGTCFLCGEGICPQGAYCARDAAGGPACAWLPECSKTPNCACLTDVLGSGCSCNDDAGGPAVTCQ